MSAKLAEEFLKDSPFLYDLPEESWEETLRPPQAVVREQKTTRHLNLHPDKGETEKKYRLVFNRDAEAVRLEPTEWVSREPAEGEVALDRHIADAIEASQRILEFEDDWDDEGSPRYEKSTLIRATKFVKNAAISYWNISKSWPPPPRILPGPEGSIDIHWKTENRELLVNIPENDEIPAGYYGSGGPQDTVKGKLDTSSQNLWVLMWLLR